MSAKPTVVIGGSGSSAEASLYFVTGAAILSDGRIVVTDGGWGRSRVALFSPDGRYLSTLGGTGDGPGEFRSTWGVQVGPNDSVFVWDESPQRLSVFSRDGSLARTATLLIGGKLAGTEGLGGVTRLVGGTWAGIGSAAVFGTAPGQIRRDTIRVGLLDGTLRHFRPAERLPGMMFAEATHGVGQAPFSPTPFAAGWGRCVFTSVGDTRSIDVYSAAAKLVTTLHGPGQGRPVTAADMDALLAYKLSQLHNGHDSTFVRQWLREAGRAGSLPYYYQISADPWGELWLEKYEPPRGRGTLWYVVSQSGALVDTVRLPTAMWVYSITREGVLGLVRGSLGEEKVELFPFVETPARHPEPLPECAPSE